MLFSSSYEFYDCTDQVMVVRVDVVWQQLVLALFAVDSLDSAFEDVPGCDDVVLDL